jgi:hypothetical protein
MTLYARSDVMSVTVPAESGGCGKSHSRPVHGGKPDKDWPLNCLPCETFLKKDVVASEYKKTRLGNGSRDDLKLRWPSLWGWTPDSRPETPDEENRREHDEQETATNAANANKDALTTIAAALAGNQEVLARLAAMVAPQALPSDPILPEPLDPGAERPEPRTWEYPVGGLEKTSSYDQRECRDCGTPIIRAPGQKGALPQRCPDCKAKTGQR